ncbi:MAG: penicillin-binding protein 2 [Patescibacteria group bacterium]|nr:penicillin-binding protein 2 [Patescibacteria group bacterium]
MKRFKYIKPNNKQCKHDPFVVRDDKFNDSKLSGTYRAKWAEDAYFENYSEMETVGNNFNYKILIVFASFLFLAMFVLLAKSAYLQIMHGEYYYELAEGNRIRIERVEARRGVIYDRERRALVRNQANFMLYFIPADMPDEKEERKRIFKIIENISGNISMSELQEKYAQVEPGSLESYRPLFVIDKISYEPAIKLMLEADIWPGVILTNKTKRFYPVYDLFDEYEAEKNSRHSLSHIIGYTGKINDIELEQYGDEYLLIDYIGKMGIEYFWENELRGQSGKKHIEVDALGKEKKIIRQIEPVDGHNLLLSIDIRQQLELEKILSKQLEKIDKTKGIAILLDPNNGEVIAMVSLPAYNNNLFAQGISQEDYKILINHADKPLFNRAISGEYPSGSTIKPVWLAAALEERIVSENTKFLSIGGISIGQWFFPDWRAGGHGMVDARRAIAESVNTYFYNIGGGYKDFQGLGVDRLSVYGELFGLGKQTGIDLAGEASGFLPNREWKEEYKGESWYIGDTYHFAIGQGDLLTTPLQVAMFTSVFANGGKLYRPHFIKEILTGADQSFGESNNAPVREDFIAPYNIHVVREGMRQAVTAGSARSLQTVPAKVAGKTGTAQWSSKHDTHAWFTGFAPYDDPELVITILIEEGGGGDVTAVPVAREYLEWYFGEYKKE